VENAARYVLRRGLICGPFCQLLRALGPGCSWEDLLEERREAEVRCEFVKADADESKLPFVEARTGVQQLTVIQLVVGEALWCAAG